ncbi:hypothetical protein Tsubulata_001406 [Turnera subulata]|uniref:Uncharacterized protein n=1 Tax=Turnera subulata TaxID=218843 RepID=A0A9Q0J3A4_9ROSI|nr:hypothetical protein Tsubulata_050871 [Turnera subulata]KAJ4829471.1 hypothetical protein Tsubulata_001406 [Turnera subulata]
MTILQLGIAFQVLMIDGEMPQFLTVNVLHFALKVAKMGRVGTARKHMCVTAAVIMRNANEL